jgi:hypothetical protein
VKIAHKILPSIILAELLPSTEHVKTDLSFFLSISFSIEQTFSSVVSWLTSLRWIDSKISSRYDFDALLGYLVEKVLEFL